MNQEIKKMPMRADALELQELATKGAAFYTKQRCRGMDMEQRNMIFNAVAHGIVMGWRRYEHMAGIIEGESWEPAIKNALGVISDGK